MKTKLITALRTAANAIQSGQFPYNWNNLVSCNCGVVVCAITGKAPVHLLSSEDLRVATPKNRDTSLDWSEFAGMVCPITGAPTHHIFKQLYEVGMLPSDIRHLEYLSDAKILKRVGRALNYKKGTDVVDYLRAWADMLVEEGRADVPAPQDSVEIEFMVKPEILGIKGI